MTPPKLTGNTPVLNVLKPLTVNAAPLFRENVDFAGCDGLKTDLSDGFTGGEGTFGRRLAHGHVPLLRKHWLDDFTRTSHTRNHVLDFTDADKVSGFFKIVDPRFAAFRTSHASVLFGNVFVHARIFCENVDHLQVVALTDRKVVKVVPRCHFHDAGTEFLINVGIADDREEPVHQRRFKALAD